MQTSAPAAIQKASPSSGQNKTTVGIDERQAYPTKDGLLVGRSNSRNSHEDVVNSDKSEEFKGPQDLVNEVLIAPLNSSNPSQTY